MILKIRIKTPQGHATGTEQKIRGWLMPRGVVPDIKCNKEDSIIIWTVDVDSRRAAKIMRNVAIFDTTVSTIIKSKLFLWYAKREVGADGIKQFEDMLKNHTKVSLVKENEKVN